MVNGNMLTWAEKARSVDGTTSTNIKNTIDKYSEIESLGLETVMWNQYSSDKLLTKLHRIEQFIYENHPCLFIFDPKSNMTDHNNIPVKKGFLFDVRSINAVYGWVSQNLSDIDKYNYLITTQIENPGDGFVESVFSEGNGKMWCETLHTSKVCNQRDLSQLNQKFANLNEYVNQLFIESDGVTDIWSVNGKHLTRRDILDLQELYSQRSGYFEFVKGVQAGKKGIYTIGYESRGLFVLHDLLHKTGCMDNTSRLNGILLREGMR